MRTPVFDAHVDSLQRALDLGDDLGSVTGGHLDLVRGRIGGLQAVVLVCWVDPVHMETNAAGARCRELLERYHVLLERHPKLVSFGGNGRLVAEAKDRGLIAGIAGIEGGHSIEESLERLEEFFEGGVRVMTLVWNNHLSWIRSCRDGAGPDTPAGLNDFGRDVVRRMNELGMLVDLSHASDQAFYDTLEVSDRPVIASHSGCRAVNDHPRNLNDDQLKALGENGGVMGAVFCTPFLDGDCAAALTRLRDSDEHAAIDEGNEAATFFARARFLQESAPPLPIARVCDHICHAAELAGVEHVGIGSDYDGIDHTPAGLEDASRYPALAAALLQRGFTEAELKGIFWGNMARAFASATGEGTRAFGLEAPALV
jgi:membrane dipeptidase